jgi:hypothetical protein
MPEKGKHRCTKPPLEESRQVSGEAHQVTKTDPRAAPSAAKLVAICVVAGPAIFAFLYCLNSEIFLLFFAPRGDHPTIESVVAVLVVLPVALFMWMYVVNVIGFACLAGWLLLLSKIMRTHIFAGAIIFIPVMTFISCKVYGRYSPVDFDDSPPPLVFGTALLWEFPLRGFLPIFIFTAISVAACAAWLSRR